MEFRISVCLMNLTKIQKVKNHTDIKNNLLKLISKTPGKKWTNSDKTDLDYDVTFTDWEVNQEYDYKKYYLKQLMQMLIKKHLRPWISTKLGILKPNTSKC